MPLKLDLKHGEKMIINGATLENVGPSAKILVHNLANILREKEILTQADAATPASRVYFALQCAYMFPESRAEHLGIFKRHLKDYLDACPSARGIVEGIQENVEGKEYYKGLKATRKLIAHELETLTAFHKGMAKLAEIAAEANDGADSAFDEDDALEETS